jgi:hypothetical protein
MDARVGRDAISGIIQLQTVARVRRVRRRVHAYCYYHRFDSEMKAACAAAEAAMAATVVSAVARQVAALAR